MKEFIIFVCTDSTEIFSKLKSAGLNYMYNLPSFFTVSYCAELSNKNCFLTCFIHTILYTLVNQIYFFKIKIIPFIINFRRNYAPGEGPKGQISINIIKFQLQSQF